MNEIADLKVKQIMNNAHVTCGPASTLDEVARMMSDAEVSAIVVVDESGELLGLISQFDLLKEYGQDLKARLAKDYMVSKLIDIGPEDRVEEAARRMLAERIHRLIVIDKETNRAKGVISVSDIIRRMRQH